VTVLLLLAVAVLIAINGFFVAAEFGLVRSKRSTLQDLAADGNAGAARALTLHDDLNQYLSACQFGITLASLGIGFLGEPAIATIFEPLFGNFSHNVKIGISVAIAYVIVTGTHVVLGEQVPKIYSIIHPDRIAIFVARPLRAFNTATPRRRRVRRPRSCRSSSARPVRAASSTRARRAC
jgi:CBS domain containing-hemolysin-like protein